MFKQKILQIIPAPADMLAMFRDDDTGTAYPSRVVCLALMEDADGYRCVTAMTADADGVIDDAGEASNFCGFCFTNTEDITHE